MASCSVSASASAAPRLTPGARAARGRGCGGKGTGMGVGGGRTGRTILSRPVSVADNSGGSGGSGVGVEQLPRGAAAATRAVGRALHEFPFHSQLKCVNGLYFERFVLIWDEGCAGA